MISSGGPAVFFDRDGVLNHVIVRHGRPYPPPTLAELQIVPGAEDALVRLVERGFVLVGVTNQPDVARGTQRREVVERINAAVLSALPLRDLLTCYHDDVDNCSCRKPRPGLILEAASRYAINLSSSYLIGDRWKDVEAGQRAGCRTVLVGDGYGEAPCAHPPDLRVSSLTHAVAWILDHVTSTDWRRSGFPS